MHSELIDNNAFHGVFQVKMKDAFDPVKRDHSVNTYSRISTVSQESEQSEGVSKVSKLVNRASKRSKCSKVERVNELPSDRVARSKRDCL